MSAETATTVKLTIPGVCPSVNTLLSGRLKDRMRVKRDWQWGAFWAWHEAGRPVFSGPVTVTVRLYFETRRKRDWPNFAAGGVKILIDQLVKDGCLVGDSDDVLSMDKPQMLYDKEFPRVELTISERGESA